MPEANFKLIPYPDEIELRAESSRKLLRCKFYAKCGDSFLCEKDVTGLVIDATGKYELKSDSGIVVQSGTMQSVAYREPQKEDASFWLNFEVYEQLGRPRVLEEQTITIFKPVNEAQQSIDGKLEGE